MTAVCWRRGESAGDAERESLEMAQDFVWNHARAGERAGESRGEG